MAYGEAAAPASAAAATATQAENEEESSFAKALNAIGDDLVQRREGLLMGTVAPTAGVDARTAAQAIAQRLSTARASRSVGDGLGAEHYAIIVINDFPQRARWKVTNRETIVNLAESTGAAVTNKGQWYPPGEEPAPGGEPKLQLLIEANDQNAVRKAVAEIKRLLVETSAAAFQHEARGSTGGGRYVVN